MNPACKDIEEFLGAEASLGLTRGVDLFFGRMPDQPSVCVAIMDNPGEPPMLTLTKATSNYYYSSVSVRVRDNGYAAGWGRIFDIVTYLHGLSHIDSPDGSARYGIIRAMNDPQVLYWDKNDRVMFFVNFETQRKPI